LKKKPAGLDRRAWYPVRITSCPAVRPKKEYYYYDKYGGVEVLAVLCLRDLSHHANTIRINVNKVNS